MILWLSLSCSPLIGADILELTVIITSVIQVLYKILLFLRGYVLGPQNAIQYTV